MLRTVSGWGQYPQIKAEYTEPVDYKHVYPETDDSVIPRGLGRSYGDSALSQNIIGTTYLNHFLAFDTATGALTCQAGVSFEEIIHVFLPRGWFLPVTPGTKFITVGGAIASDVHGKNHHAEGCFSEFVSSIKLLLPDGTILICTKTENSELFRATCGGMGLTGVILEATFALKKVNSAYIDQKTFKAKNLEHIFALFEEQQGVTYSVAWIDCLAKNKKLGRSLLMVGEHADDGDLDLKLGKALSVPVNAPDWTLSPMNIKIFNTLYYNKVLRAESSQKVSLNTFFYPLDQLHHWNRLYGKNGFTQYQFVLPMESGLEGMREVLEIIAESNNASFLAVLKLFGKENENYISFPFKGYTLALDFKLSKKTLDMLNRLDKIVLHHGGRVYLTKDVRMSEFTFKASYPRYPEFHNVLKKYPVLENLNSLQSKRLGMSHL